MKKALVCAAAGAAAWLGAGAAAMESVAITLDTRTLAAGDCGPTAVDARGLTRDESDDIALDTKIPRGTLLLLK